MEEIDYGYPMTEDEEVWAQAEFKRYYEEAQDMWSEEYPNEPIDDEARQAIRAAAIVMTAFAVLAMRMGGKTAQA